MLGEETFFASDKLILTPATAKYATTPEFYRFFLLVTHNHNFRANMTPQRCRRSYIGRRKFLYPTSISKHKRQKNRRPPRNLSFFGGPTTLILEKILCSKIAFFDRATSFALVHMFAEEIFLIPNKHI